MVDRPKFVFDVVDLEDRGNRKEVTLEGRVPKLIPDIIAGNRARVKAITVSGLVDASIETIEDLSQGDLSRVTDVLDVEEIEENPATKEVRYHISVKSD